MIPPFAARYSYRHPKYTTPLGPWAILTSALASPASADALVDYWNQRDRGRYLWRWEECLPQDFDYPLRST